MAKLVYFMPVSKSYYKKATMACFTMYHCYIWNILKCNPQINAHTLYTFPPRFARIFVALQAN